MDTISDEELLAYADELLETELSTHVEKLLRHEKSIRERLKILLEERDQGNLGIGDLWRHERLSCPQLSELGLYLIGALEEKLQDYISFHLQHVGCRYCQATLEEMQSASAVDALDQNAIKRREQLFASSAALLRKTE